MFQFLIRTISPTSPKLVSSPNNPWPWLASRLISIPFSSSSSSSSSSKDNSFVVSYLVGTFGFSPERAITLSKRFGLETREKPDTVIAFLKSHGLSQTTALRVLRSVPGLLVSYPEKSLQPKIDFFKAKGFSTSDIRKIIAGCPSILTRSLQNEIIPCFDFFDNMFQSKDKLMKAVIRFSGILCDFGRCIEPNIQVLREVGVPDSLIVKLIQYFARALKTTPKLFKETVQEVKELELNPLKLQFVVAIHVKISVGRSSWERREGIYRKWGWTDDNISAAFRMYPWCMAISDDKIEAIMDFLVNKLGYTSSAIARCPVVLTMSLEKRIIPRGSVILALLSKGLVNKLSLSAMFQYNEMIFLDKFVYCHVKEADELLKLYEAKLSLDR